MTGGELVAVPIFRPFFLLHDFCHGLLGALPDPRPFKLGYHLLPAALATGLGVAHDARLQSPGH